LLKEKDSDVGELETFKKEEIESLTVYLSEADRKDL
jgi:hypothetical protein